MSTTKSAPRISIRRPGRGMPELAANPDEWIRDGDEAEQQPPAPKPEAPAHDPENEKAQAPESTENTEDTENTENKKTREPEEPSASTPERETGGKKNRIYTLDIPKELHRVIRRTAYTRDTTMAADIRRILTDTYGTGKPPTNIPHYDIPEPGPDVQRITIEMSRTLHRQIKINTIDSGVTMYSEIRHALELEYGQDE